MESGELSSYQLMIQKNIEENRRVLRSLGLALATPVTPKQKISRPSYVRKSISRPKNQQSAAPNNFQPNRINTRRSSILQSVNVDGSPAFPDTNNDEENTPPQKKIKSELIFGEIAGVRVGDWWPTRLECSAAGVHRPTVAGIHGKQDEGCYSIALSGGYEDDIDFGNVFTYTGAGGRDLKGTKCNPKNLRTAPQSKDQVLEGSNAALASNVESKKPVRVIRGFKLQSPYAPEEGYRYDGLYSVEKYWTATGLSGFKVYKFALKRLAGQDPPPWESCAQETEPPTTEESLSLPQIDKMNTTKTFTSKIECFNDCSLQLPPKTALRDRARKQSFPRQHLANDYESSDDDESISIFSSEFQEKSENDNLFKESLKLRENVPNVVNCLENNTDSTFVKCHTNVNVQSVKVNVQSVKVNVQSVKVNVQSVKENNVLQRSNGEILPHLCTTLLTPVKNKNSDSFKDLNSQIVCSPNSSEKRVTFTPAVAFSHRKYHEAKTEGEENDSTVLEMSSYSNNQKQATILNYFSPVKKQLENVSPKSTVSPKSLRSNRLPYPALITLGIETIQRCDPLNKNKSVLNNESIVPARENDCSNSIKKTSPKKEVKSSSHKRKYSSSFTKHKEFSDLPISKNAPSMMENLIKQNNDKLKLHNRIRPTKRKNNYTLSPVKPCSVFLKRIRVEDSNETDFIGWDVDSEHLCGFKEIDLIKAQVTCDTFKAFVQDCNNFQQSPEKQEIELNGFPGWDVNKDEFKGTTELVPIAFIIDKLSKHCVQRYLE